jgi:aminopeptidase N
MNHKMTRFLAMTVVLIVGASCSGNKSAVKTESQILEAEGSSLAKTLPTALSRREAASRSKQIGHVAYNLYFGLDAEHDDFEGRTVINFDLKPRAKDHGTHVFLDFEDGIITEITLNGVLLPPSDSPGNHYKDRYDLHRLAFKLSELQAGANRIEIAYRHPFSGNGDGLYRFKDPEDAKVYLYTNFEPYGAHKVFPCFDQPDLKASFELTVETPEDWEVISNTKERDVSNVDGRKSWAFPPSPLLSTYVFALHAGPYKVWKGDADGIPLRLFARATLAPYVDDKEWFQITREGLAYYANAFGYPYPYSKYDQILVPDFNAGAMENAAAVTFSEHYIYRSKVTTDTHMHRASTILHEMAHMWFGDLVTMRWWNGLWLNESFATFMATRAVDQATSFKGAWQSFESMKLWAYAEDQQTITHPIEVPVADTDVASSNFDGITYAKGASSLQQLAYFVGEDEFAEGVQRYFQKFALRNTTTTDFMKMISEASGVDLTKWQKLWLMTPGLNTVQADFACAPDSRSRNRITRLDLLQGSAEMNTELRPHKVEVALFYKKNGKLQPGEIFPTTENVESNPVKDATGKPCPDFIFPNYKDHDYVKVELDPVSLKTATQDIALVQDPMLRQMVWHTLWQMVKDVKLKASDYIDSALKNLGREKDPQIVETVLYSLASGREGSAIFYLGGDQRKTYREKLDSFARAKFLSAAPGSDLQIDYFQLLEAVAISPESLDLARGLLSGKKHVSGFKVDQDRRWNLISILAMNGAQDAPELIQNELKRDPSDTGVKSSVGALASIPTPENKTAWFAKIMRASGEAIPIGTLRRAMANFYELDQEAQVRPFEEAYFAEIPKLTQIFQADEQYASRFASSMFPARCEADLAEKTGALLAAHPELPAPIIKSLRVAKQETERCVKIRAFAGGAAAAVPSPSPSPSPSAASTPLM